MKNTKKIIAGVLALAAAMAISPMSVFAEDKNTTVSMDLDRYDELYYVTIPMSVEAENPGWNALGSGIKVEKAEIAGTDPKEYKLFNPAKKVTVTAASANDWKLVTTESTQSIGYTLKKTADDTTAAVSWDFSAAEITQEGTTKTAGVDVNADDYNAVPAGTYADRITFTIAVANS